MILFMKIGLQISNIRSGGGEELRGWTDDLGGRMTCVVRYTRPRQAHGPPTARPGGPPREPGHGPCFAAHGREVGGHPTEPARPWAAMGS
jgi:hypothetical protein